MIPSFNATTFADLSTFGFAGTATDATSGIAEGADANAADGVLITLQRASDGQYWNFAGAWVAGPVTYAAPHAFARQHVREAIDPLVQLGVGPAPLVLGQRDRGRIDPGTGTKQRADCTLPCLPRPAIGSEDLLPRTHHESLLRQNLARRGGTSTARDAYGTGW